MGRQALQATNSSGELCRAGPLRRVVPFPTNESRTYMCAIAQAGRRRRTFHGGQL